MSAIWVDSSGDVWLFGGTGYDATVAFPSLLSDLWKYSNGQWTWMGGPNLTGQKGMYGTRGTGQASNIPGGRFSAFTWTDASGNLWLFGGIGYDSSGASGWLNDLWKYGNGQWTWMGGSNLANQPGVYGVQGTASASNIPGARQAGAAWTDASGNAWLFGGNGFTESVGAFELNDLWKYSGGQWTWISGSNISSESSAFGTEGMLYPGNTPGGRDSFGAWKDAKGNFWLFGGYGETPAQTGNLNDLWMYMP
jgi:N-acetylneuraminic acid mutarotase